MSTPQILLVDDHAMFRTGLSLVIKSAIPDAAIFGANSLDEAMSVDADTMDIVVLDIQLQGLSGLECVPMIKRKWPSVPVLMLTSHTETQNVRLAMARGAAAFISKAETADTITDTICKLLSGDGCTPSLTPAPAPKRALTPRQCEVIDLMHQGLSNKLIARRLNLSDNTVRRHVQDILEFFAVSSRTEAVFMARRQGLVD
jgi:DNA-binding NarL/FixJ family response regulator